MNTQNQDLLASFKKSNKERRQRLAEKAGFKTAEDYMSHLLNRNVKQPSKSSKKETIHVVDILDCSGSMGGAKFENALHGIRNEVKEFQKINDVNYNFTLVTFGDLVSIDYFNVPVREVETISARIKGLTALNQAVGETLLELMKIKTSQRVLVNIFTDGQENASRGRFRNPSELKELIKKCENLGFTITFIGTESDVKFVNKHLNIDLSNTLVHQNTAASIADSFMSKLGATMSYASAVTKGATKEQLLKGFYKQKGKL